MFSFKSIATSTTTMNSFSVSREVDKVVPYLKVPFLVMFVRKNQSKLGISANRNAVF
jgi:hypothetical protein